MEIEQTKAAVLFPNICADFAVIVEIKIAENSIEVKLLRWVAVSLIDTNRCWAKIITGLDLYEYLSKFTENACFGIGSFIKIIVLGCKDTAMRSPLSWKLFLILYYFRI